MMHMGLQLLTVALESGHLANYQSLLVLVKDELCRHLLQVLEDAEENIVLYCDKKQKKILLHFTFVFVVGHIDAISIQCSVHFFFGNVSKRKNVVFQLSSHYENTH